MQGREEKGWTLVVTADSRGCRCCKLTALKFLWRCENFKKYLKHSGAVKTCFKGAFSVHYCKIEEENVLFLWWIWVEVASKEDRRGNMYENEQSNVPSAPISTEKWCRKILRPGYHCSATHRSSLLPASLPGLKNNNNANAHRHMQIVTWLLSKHVSSSMHHQIDWKKRSMLTQLKTRPDQTQICMQSVFSLTSVMQILWVPVA